MNRLTKKCMIASAGMHALLILALFVGSAFSSRKVEPSVPVIDLINFSGKVTDDPTSGGGDPTITEAPAPAPEPEPAPPAPPQKDPEPEPEQSQPEPVRPEPPQPQKQPDPPKLEPVKTKEPDVVVPKVTKAPEKREFTLKPVNTKTAAKTPSKPVETKPTKPKFELSKVTRPKTSSTSTATSNTRNQNANGQAKLASDVRKSLGNIASSIRNNTSSGTTVGTPGTGGEAYVNYSHLVGAIFQRAYDRALTTAGEIADRDDSVDVAVVIGRSGRIISSRITRNSGNPALNKLVKGVLDRVDTVPGFPEAARDSQRTFNITFDLKSRRLTG